MCRSRWSRVLLLLIELVFSQKTFKSEHNLVGCQESHTAQKKSHAEVQGSQTVWGRWSLNLVFWPNNFLAVTLLTKFDVCDCLSLFEPNFIPAKVSCKTVYEYVPVFNFTSCTIETRKIVLIST